MTADCLFPYFEFASHAVYAALERESIDNCRYVVVLTSESPLPYSIRRIDDIEPSVTVLFEEVAA